MRTRAAQGAVFVLGRDGMTIYLWHLPLFIALNGIALLVGVPFPAPGSATWWATRAVALVVVLAVALGGGAGRCAGSTARSPAWCPGPTVPPGRSSRSPRCCTIGPAFVVMQLHLSFGVALVGRRAVPVGVWLLSRTVAGGGRRADLNRFSPDRHRAEPRRTSGGRRMIRAARTRRATQEAPTPSPSEFWSIWHARPAGGRVLLVVAAVAYGWWRRRRAPTRRPVAVVADAVLRRGAGAVRRPAVRHRRRVRPDAALGVRPAARPAVLRGPHVRRARRARRAAPDRRPGSPRRRPPRRHGVASGARARQRDRRRRWSPSRCSAVLLTPLSAAIRTSPVGGRRDHGARAGARVRPARTAVRARRAALVDVRHGGVPAGVRGAHARRDPRHRAADHEPRARRVDRGWSGRPGSRRRSATSTWRATCCGSSPRWRTSPCSSPVHPVAADRPPRGPRVDALSDDALTRRDTDATS